MKGSLHKKRIREHEAAAVSILTLGRTRKRLPCDANKEVTSGFSLEKEMLAALHPCSFLLHTSVSSMGASTGEETGAQSHCRKGDITDGVHRRRAERENDERVQHNTLRAP